MTGKNQNNIIQMQDVDKTYSTGDNPFMALNNVNIDILFHWVGNESPSPSIPIHALNKDKLALWRGVNI